MNMPLVRIADGRPEKEVKITGIVITATPRPVPLSPMVCAFIREGVLFLVPPATTVEAGIVGTVTTGARRRATMEGTNNV